ncbi:MAG: SMP-30/gluconolactonase/LRE family protein [Acidimicrobiia bacterium]|nr:SMP-30/gluconolactonase/LRE family protein [Acidimicrobiia bacterium]
MHLNELATGLKFPEGPVVLDNGDVILVEIARGTLTKVGADGAVSVVADLGGGPNGAALGPDGAMYICNNGGCFSWVDVMGFTIPGAVPPEWTGGSIQRVDLTTGVASTLYTESSSGPLRAPNDLIFDGHGGFWFTDHGVRLERSTDRTGIHYARVDGSACTEMIFPLDAPNGVGLSPDGTRLYAAETHTGRVYWWALSAPGEVSPENQGNPYGNGGQLLAGLPGLQLLDSLAVDGEGWVCVGTLVNGGITAISPDGATIEHVPLPDQMVTNICFGGADRRTAYCTLSSTGALVSFEWPRAGLRLHHTQ